MFHAARWINKTGEQRIFAQILMKLKFFQISRLGIHIRRYTYNLNSDNLTKIYKDQLILHGLFLIGGPAHRFNALFIACRYIRW